ncbi:hypothetical protein OG301_30725 [Streptomyces platensis]|uniref:hypothetical protein n=1 Tax=Streptomyces TaxID=1883 RepID=UPI00224EEC5D|nr:MULTISPECIES: hypothetical protein [Streptomyces]MCX4635039.1 hypothetical protein [Streptomyces platensis]WJY41468.1 hypothetical protein QT196_31675 [Streptomyces sp. P9-2B-2]WTI55384.1 hypothetical protein OG301_30725 [Streptomyces platensis]WUB79035.1 hypothetical protein OG424_07545 [Streptomyces platensis]
MISHVTIDRRDLTYDPRAQQAALPVTIHHREGDTEPSLLVMDPGQVELYAIQLEQAIAKRKAAQEGAA